MKQITGFDFLNSLDSEVHDNTVEMQAACPELVNNLVSRLYGDIYQRTNLTLRERLFITIAILMTSSNSRPQLASQLHIALKNDITRDELMEIAQQISLFSGFPKAINAMLIIDKVASETNSEK